MSQYPDTVSEASVSDGSDSESSASPAPQQEHAPPVSSGPLPPLPYIANSEPVAPVPISSTPQQPESEKRDVRFRVSDETRIEIVRMLIIGWKPQEIAPRLKISAHSVYTVKKNLMKYGNSEKPKRKDIKVGRKPKMSAEDEKALYDWLIRDGWKEQSDMTDWLLEERGVKMTRSALSRVLRRRNWNENTIKKVGGKGMKVTKERRRRGPGKKTLMRAGLLDEDGKPVPQPPLQQQPEAQLVNAVASIQTHNAQGLLVDPQLGGMVHQAPMWGYRPPDGV